MKTIYNTFYFSTLSTFFILLSFNLSAQTGGGSTCANALPISYGTHYATFTNTDSGASTSPCLFPAATNAQWYVFTAPADGFFHIGSCGYGQDTRLSVWEGSNCGNLVSKGCNDDACEMGIGMLNYASLLEAIPVTAGNQYYIEWDDYWSPNPYNWDLTFYYCTTGASNVIASPNGNMVTISWTYTNSNTATVIYVPSEQDPLGVTASSFTHQSGDSLTFTTGYYDFYVVDTCIVNGQQVINYVPSGCTYIGDFTQSTVVAPFTASFESCGQLSDFWMQSTQDQHDWIYRTGNTPSQFTGPDGAFEGNYYAHYEASFPSNYLDSAELISDTIDISNLSAPVLRFNYHMYGVRMGRLKCYANDGNGWSKLWEKRGNQGMDWHETSIDLGNFGNTLQIKFTMIDSTSYQSDASIDNIRVEEYCQEYVEAPYFESFESQDSFSLICGNQSLDDVFDWSVTNSATPSGSTGANSGFDGDYFLFTEASSPRTAGDSAIWISPFIRIDTLTYPSLFFAYHMEGSSMGTLRVEMQNFRFDNWETIWEISGDQGSQWNEAKVNLMLAQADSIVRFRFVGVVGYDPINNLSWQSDISIDKVEVKNDEPTNMRVLEMVSDFPSCAQPNVPIAFEVENIGFVPLQNITYGFEINGSLTSETYANTIQPGQTVILTPSAGVDLVNSGWNTIHFGLVGTSYNDSEPINDFTSIDVHMMSDDNGSNYATSFEANTSGWFGEGDWEYGAPNNTLISSASDGSKAWVTNLSDDYSQNTISYLYSPCLDFSDYDEDPTLSFDVFWDLENEQDKAWLEMSLDGGYTWTKVGANGMGANWYNSTNDYWTGDGSNGSNSWLKAELILSGTQDDQSVDLRFVIESDATSNFEGFAIDSINIKVPIVVTPCPPDLGLTITTFPASAPWVSDAGIVVTPTLGTPPYTYIWSNGATSPVVDSLAGGTSHAVLVTDAMGCSDTITVITQISTVISTNEITSLKNIQLFPNPTNSIAHLALAFDKVVDVDIEIVNTLGQVILQNQQDGILEKTFHFNTNSWASGIYLVRIRVGDGQIVKRLMVK